MLRQCAGLPPVMSRCAAATVLTHNSLSLTPPPFLFLALADSAELLVMLLSTFKDANHILVARGRGIHIILREEADARDIVKAYLQVRLCREFRVCRECLRDGPSQQGVGAKGRQAVVKFCVLCLVTWVLVLQGKAWGVFRAVWV